MTTPLAKKINAIRLTLGLDQAEFGAKLGTTQSAVSRWERGSRPKHEFLAAIATIANTTIDKLLSDGDVSAVPADAIPVVGIVGAGAEVLPYDDYGPGDGMDYVERPSGITGQVVAVEVRGDSLFPTAENGWRLIYAGEQTVLEEEVLNRICVVQLTDGRMLVKRVLRGSQPRRYHLQSTNAPLIEDAEVVWAARVKAIIPN